MHTKDNREREVKFYISDIQNYRKLLEKAGAHLIKDRVYELNYRFDTDTNSLKEKRQVLRLRKDDQIRLTFKDQTIFSEGIADRRELEICVDDFDATLSMLEALGFSVFIIYEKYRTTYHLNQCEVVLDELPFGTFLEIEGVSVESIQATSDLLKLNWNARITCSYLELFTILKNNNKTDAKNILFSEFEDTSFSKRDFFSI